ncbi:MAG: Ger(x)C family spore germination protein, partial [Hyphomonadaceae bacterium]|nr:Ger(x)C family spore germination protein [Clostridia bacterium]
MQTYIRVMLLSVLLMVLSTVLCGCWNYREIDKMSIVAGLAVDKSEDNQYSVTVEVVDIKGGADIRILPRTITSHGETVFDTIRNTISLSGKRLFWSHTKVLILSKAIASDDIVKILDWYIRDSETRGEINIIVSKESTAKEILESKAITDEVVSYKLNDMIEGEKSVSKAPIISIYDFITDLAGNGISPIAPVVSMEKSDSVKSPSINGCALFAKSRLIDFLDADDTKDLLFVRDMIKGGVLVQSENG